jgi:hypothetical protein
MFHCLEVAAGLRALNHGGTLAFWIKNSVGLTGRAGEIPGAIPILGAGQ